MTLSSQWFRSTGRTADRRSRLRMEALEDRCTPAIMTVTGVGDTVAVDGVVTLREAILSANADAAVNADVVASGSFGTDTINFNIAGSGVQTINLTSALPGITGNLTIDGFTQVGALANTLIVGDSSTHLVAINAAALGVSGDALLIASGGNTTIRGLVITGAGVGVHVGDDATNTNVVIEGNFIGVDATGTARTSNSSTGVLIEANASGVQVGGSTPAARNVISGNAVAGIAVAGNSAVMLGNYIGLNATGTAAVGNVIGIDVTGSNVVIGGADLGAGNIISGNVTGVLVEGLSTGVQILGNTIGANAAGTAAVGNTGNGISITTGTNVTIGGSVLGAGNLIAYNGGIGINLSGATTGDVFMQNRVFGNIGAAIVPNFLQASPVVVSVNSSGSQTFVTGTVTATPNTQVRVELFATSRLVAEGETFLGATTVTTDALGTATLSVTLNANVAGKLVTATAMNLTTGETSAFSAAVRVTTSLTAAAAGAKNTPEVLVLNGDSTTRFTLNPFPGFFGGVHVAVGDVTGDGTDDIVVGAGAGMTTQVRVYDGLTGTQLTGAIGSFMAYGPSFGGGVYVAAADVTGDGKADIITGAGPSGGPHVEVFDATNGSVVASFFAYNPTFRGGVTVAGGLVNADNKAEVITGAGAGGGPHVKVIDGTMLNQLQANAVISNSALIFSFYAYPSTFSGGVFVAAGDVNGDLSADIITGAGAGIEGPHVKVFSGLDASLLAEAMALDASFEGGIRVAAADVDANGLADVIVGAGAGGGVTQLTTLRGINLSTMTTANVFDPSFLGGIFVG